MNIIKGSVEIYLIIPVLPIFIETTAQLLTSILWLFLFSQGILRMKWYCDVTPILNGYGFKNMSKVIL